MNGTQQLKQAGQSIWLDNITRGLLSTGTLKRYIDDFSVTGLTSNPTIFDLAIRKSDAYDDDIRRGLAQSEPAEQIFFDLAIADLSAAADLLRDVHRRTDGQDGWVSLEVSPVLAYDTASTVQQVAQLHAKAARPNLFIKIPGTPEGLPAIEESIVAGIPINVTLLFSREQYLASADAYLKGLERRQAAGLSLDVRSVASVFVSRWDKPVQDKLPPEQHNKLGIAIGRQAYKAYRELLGSARWQKLATAGARPQRLLFASTGTKDPKASDVLYVEALAAPDTINTMPEATLLALADHGQVLFTLPPDGGDWRRTLDEHVAAGIDLDALALKLQADGAKAFVDSWTSLIDCIGSKAEALKRAS